MWTIIITTRVITIIIFKIIIIAMITQPVAKSTSEPNDGVCEDCDHHHNHPQHIYHHHHHRQIIIIMMITQPVVKSASEPNDGVCEDGEGWGCIAEIATTVMDCIAEIGMDANGVQKCVEEAIGTASDCWDCVCWVMESIGLGCPTA